MKLFFIIYKTIYLTSTKRRLLTGMQVTHAGKWAWALNFWWITIINGLDKAKKREKKLVVWFLCLWRPRFQAHTVSTSSFHFIFLFKKIFFPLLCTLSLSHPLHTRLKCTRLIFGLFQDHIFKFRLCCQDQFCLYFMYCF